MTEKSMSGSFQANSSASAADQAGVGSTVQQVTDQAKETAGQVAGQARQQVTSQLAGQKDRVAEGLRDVAQALRQTGQQLHDQDHAGFTDYIDSAASQVEHVSDYLHGRDVGEMIDDVERFARRQPALFVGGAFALGLLGVRFLKSSRQHARGMGTYPSAEGQRYGYSGEAYGQGYARAYGAASEYGGTRDTASYGTSGTTSYGTGTGITGYGTGVGTTGSGTTTSAERSRTTEES